MSYAKDTKVPVGRSQDEIQKILARYKATSFVYGTSPGKAVVMFEMQGRRIKFVLPMPQEPSSNATGASIRTYEQLCRVAWRCLVLAIKAKLECVESGITTMEQEFLAHIMLPNGRTVGDVMVPQIAMAYDKKQMPPLLGFDP